MMKMLIVQGKIDDADARKVKYGTHQYIVSDRFKHHFALPSLSYGTVIMT